jgi:uncharacterized damage-inducible protein DinB
MPGGSAAFVYASNFQFFKRLTEHLSRVTPMQRLPDLQFVYGRTTPSSDQFVKACDPMNLMMTTMTPPRKNRTVRRSERCGRGLAITCATIVIASAAPVLAQGPATASIQAEVLKDWTALKETLMKIADEMPVDGYAFKPTPAQETFGRRVVHIAVGGNRFLELMGGKAAAPKIDAAAAATSKTAAMKALADSFDYGTAIIKSQTDQTMLQTVDAPFLGPSSRARVFTFVMGHTWDLYGQLAVYLRLQGHVPPASQRP